MGVLTGKIVAALLFADFLAELTLCSERERKVLVIPGDVYIGGLFPVHDPPEKREYSGTCGLVRENTGVTAVEAFLATLNSINQNPVLMPNLSLGAVIRDSCFYLPGALKGAMEFVQDRIHFAETTGDGGNSSRCDSAPPVVAVLGPFTDHFTQAAQRLFRVFAVPQIGLSPRGRHRAEEPFLLRVPPSAHSHAQAILDLVLTYNWTYISAVYSEDAIGYTLYSEFEGLLRAAGACLATVARVSGEQGPGEFQYDRIVEQLTRNSRSRAVVCFCDSYTTGRLLEAIVRNNMEGHLVVIGSSDWTRRSEILRGVETAAVGGLSVVQAQTGQFSDRLAQHLRSLRPETNSRNPWLAEFWEKKFTCFQAVDGQGVNNTCSGNETLDSIDIGVEHENVAQGVYALVLSLDAMVKGLCPDGCPDVTPTQRGELLIAHLRNVTFEQNGRFFDRNGDGPAKYDVMNYQRTADPMGLPRYGESKVGSWLDGELHMMYDMVQWPTGREAGTGGVPESICSRPCAPGHIKVTSGRSQCCWVCVACPNLTCTGQ